MIVEHDKLREIVEDIHSLQVVMNIDNVSMCGILLSLSCDRAKYAHITLSQMQKLLKDTYEFDAKNPKNQR
jgi:hypothetical protein